MPDSHSPFDNLPSRSRRSGRSSYSRRSVSDIDGLGGRRTRPPRQKNKVAVALAVSFLVLLVGALGYIAYTYSSVRSKLAPPKEQRKEIEEALDEPKPAQEDPYEYVLLLGNDRRSGQTRARTDTIVVARLSKADRSVLMVSIPRDTRTEVPGYGVTKINHASAYGGVPLAIKTVRKFTGLPIHHYVQIDFEGFGKVVDALGGVDMYVDAPVNYGQGVTVGVGQQHLNGKEALSVMRNRKAYADGDLGRIRSQQRFIVAIARKASDDQNLSRLPSILGMSADHMETDLSMGEAVSLVRSYGKAMRGTIPSYTVPGKPGMIGGVSYIIPDKAKTKALFAAIKRGETPPK